MENPTVDPTIPYSIYSQKFVPGVSWLANPDGSKMTLEQWVAAQNRNGTNYVIPSTGWSVAAVLGALLFIL